MTDRHKRHPIPFRPTEGDRSRLAAYAEQTGRAVNAILSDALREYLERRESDTGHTNTTSKLHGCNYP